LTGGLANPVLSLVEDLAAVVLFVFTVAVPVAMAVVIVVVGFFLVRRLLRRRPASPVAAT
jgi:hypothetical protein